METLQIALERVNWRICKSSPGLSPAFARELPRNSDLKLISNRKGINFTVCIKIHALKESFTRRSVKLYNKEVWVGETKVLREKPFSTDTTCPFQLYNKIFQQNIFQ